MNGYVCEGSIGCSEKCGNAIKTSNEQCDNGNKTGCINCMVDLGYNCLGNLYTKSLCNEVCGDGIRTVS